MPDEKSARERIIDAYFDSLKTRRYDMITVSSIIRKAGVNRSTFYRHFVDIYDLYDSVCDEMAEEIVSAIHFENLDGFLDYNFDTIGRQCVNTFDVYLKYKNKIDTLSGKNGTLKVVKKFREKYAERFRKHIGSEAVGEKEEYLINLIPDCSMVIAYSVFSIRSGESYSLRDLLPNVPFRKDFMSNILTVNDILSDEKSAIEYKLLMATYNTWKKKKSINLTVSDITKAAGISRTEFYTCHKNLADFYANFETDAAYVLSKYVIDTALSDINTVESLNFDMKELTESLGTFLDSINHTFLFRFLFRCCVVALKKYFGILERETDKELIKAKSTDIMTYFCAIYITTVRYAISGNRENYMFTLKLAYRFRDENIMGFST